MRANNTSLVGQLHRRLRPPASVATLLTMEKPDFKAVFFDFGGTLFSYQDFVGHELSPAYWTSVLRLGTSVSPQEASKAYWKASRRAFTKYLNEPFYLHRDLFADTLREFCEIIDVAPKDDYIETSLEKQRRFMIDNFNLRSDCHETLRSLRDAGLVLSIVSNIDDDYLHDMIRRAELEDLLHHWSSSEEAKSCKPDPGFFEYALEKAGLQADEVLFVGDSPHHDVDGAHAAGMKTVLIEDAGPTQRRGKCEPDHRISALSELLAIAGVESR